jgi:3',5'-cyclic AMP phosphodiesterase CpdA
MVYLRSLSEDSSARVLEKFRRGATHCILRSQFRKRKLSRQVVQVAAVHGLSSRPKKDSICEVVIAGTCDFIDLHHHPHATGNTWGNNTCQTKEGDEIPPCSG